MGRFDAHHRQADGAMSDRRSAIHLTRRLRAAPVGRQARAPTKRPVAAARSRRPDGRRRLLVSIFDVRILVTGGAGFIGSHVVDGFLGAGHEVAIVDNLSTGDTANLDRNVRLYDYDIRDTALSNAFEEFKPEVVDHHAAQANVPASVADPVYDASVNVLGGLNLL